ncbi:hypothetical protein C8J57DRAFT_1577728 [Mycena rebaudengoi]|nr:hypothetical protein C8J57DRAFT_1577728 [Mycena rebaudengoi]
MKRLFGGSKAKDRQKVDTLLPPPPVQNSPLSTPIHQQFGSARSIDEERWEVVDPATGLARPHTPPRGAPEGAMMQNGGEQQQQQEDKKEKKGFWGGGGRDKEKEREHQQAMEMEQREREFQLQQQQQQRAERGREQREDNELARKIGFLTATASEDWTLVLDVCDQASSSESNAKEAVRALRREFKYGEPAAQLAAARLWAIMLRNSSDTFISQSTSRKFLDTLEDLLTSARTSPVVRERVMDVVAAAAYATGSKKDAGFRGLWRRVKPRDKPEEGVPFDTEDAMFNPPLGLPAPARPYEYHTDGNNLTNSLIANASTDNLATPPLPYYTPTPISATTSDIDVVGAGREEEVGRWGTRQVSGAKDGQNRRVATRCGVGWWQVDSWCYSRPRPNTLVELQPLPPSPFLPIISFSPYYAHADDHANAEPRKRKTSENTGHHEHRDREHWPAWQRELHDWDRGRERSKRNRIIPPDEDMRRLFQECKIGSGNAALLSQALAMATPEDLVSVVIKEFYTRCRASQELIFAQIPWASAGAERSRVAKDLEEKEKELQRMRKNGGMPNGNTTPPAELLSTREEDLLADLLAANAELIEALQLYDDLERVAIEREAEERSREGVRMDVRQRQLTTEDGTRRPDGGSSSRSRSPSPSRQMHHPLPSHPQVIGGDMTFQQPPAVHTPPHTPPHTSQPSQTRTPSPATPHHDGGIAGGAGGTDTAEVANGMGGMRMHPRDYAGRGVARG